MTLSNLPKRSLTSGSVVSIRPIGLFSRAAASFGSSPGKEGGWSNRAREEEKGRLEAKRSAGVEVRRSWRERVVVELRNMLDEMSRGEVLDVEDKERCG
jgi:hypothetical protein